MRFRGIAWPITDNCEGPWSSDELGTLKEFLEDANRMRLLADVMSVRFIALEPKQARKEAV